jgi:hypothetical protein
VVLAAGLRLVYNWGQGKLKSSHMLSKKDLVLERVRDREI